MHRHYSIIPLLDNTSNPDVNEDTKISMFSKHVIYSLLVSGAAGAAILPRTVVTVTSVRTNTVYVPPAVMTSTKTVPHTSTYTSTSFTLPLSFPADSINAGLNPVNGLPVPTSKASNTGSSPAAAINAGLNPVNGLPVPPVENSKGASKPMTPSSVQPSSSKTSSSAGLTITSLTFTTIDGTVSLRAYTSTSTRTVEPGPKSGAASLNPSPSKVSTHPPQLTALHTIPSSKKPEPTAQNPTTSSNTPSAIPKPTTSAPSSSSKVPESTSASSKSSTETKTSTETPKSSLDSSPFNTSTASEEPAPSSTSKDESGLFPSESATRGNSEGLIGM
ncbi:hypothetical protein KC340_g16023 [Hortaea werneckii]|nr:hypothetical protein KC342_g16409 [Hortaea werneckii]KAI7081924.1 hypothetical protein KC339_g13258 [Hortaea werneckii]KAI7212430.1 hypothetical protein KC365_g14603 [Hortaea werneckii]KAI7294803.1 hypothetical protein KC340_g16023 [Hortaea werneckii]KAI7380288.1 hypothetical protein KC328_g12870 [Hortaea werneckii]